MHSKKHRTFLSEVALRCSSDMKSFFGHYKRLCNEALLISLITFSQSCIPVSQIGLTIVGAKVGIAGYLRGFQLTSKCNFPNHIAVASPLLHIWFDRRNVPECPLNESNPSNTSCSSNARQHPVQFAVTGTN